MKTKKPGRFHVPGFGRSSRTTELTAILDRFCRTVNIFHPPTIPTSLNRSSIAFIAAPSSPGTAGLSFLA